MPEFKKIQRKRMKSGGPQALEDDDRFKHVFSDAKFRRIPKMERKVKVDSRFEGMFKEPQFKLTYKRDKRGRPVSKTSTEDLKKFYELESDEDEQKSDDSTVDDVNHDTKKKRTKENSEESSDEEEEPQIREDLDLRLDLARGEGNLESSSSSEEEDEEEDWKVAGENEFDSVTHDWWGEVDKNAPSIEEATKRLAVCNMNWDRMKAKDILVLLNSFKPADGLIESVSIYPSEFGKQRMEEEKLKGPAELRGTDPEMEEDEGKTDEDKEEEEKKLTEKIRVYQLQRLKYYYAVAVCDSAETANAIYEGCNGVEYETSGERVDLRFIPDDMTFDEESEDFATGIGEISNYRPQQYVDTALQLSSAQLTWDETDPERLRKTREIFDQDFEDLESNDLGGLIASGSSDEDEAAASKPKLNNLLEMVRKSEGNSLFSKRRLESSGSDQSASDQESGEESSNDKKNATRTERRKTKKKPAEINPVVNPELSLLVTEEADGEKKKHYNLSKLIDQEKKQKKKNKRGKNQGLETSNADSFNIDTSDPRFGAIYESHHYNIDPSDPSFKKTAGMKTLILKKSEMTKKRKEKSNKDSIPEKPTTAETIDIQKADDSVMSLAQSLKGKVSKLEKKRQSKNLR